MLSVAVGGGYYGIEELGEFSLVESAYTSMSELPWDMTALIELILTDEELCQ